MKDSDAESSLGREGNDEAARSPPSKGLALPVSPPILVNGRREEAGQHGEPFSRPSAWGQRPIPIQARPLPSFKHSSCTAVALGWEVSSPCFLISSKVFHKEWGMHIPKRSLVTLLHRGRQTSLRSTSHRACVLKEQAEFLQRSKASQTTASLCISTDRRHLHSSFHALLSQSLPSIPF